jgi:hypothetical protein
MRVPAVSPPLKARIELGAVTAGNIEDTAFQRGKQAEGGLAGESFARPGLWGSGCGHLASVQVNTLGTLALLVPIETTSGAAKALHAAAGVLARHVRLAALIAVALVGLAVERSRGRLENMIAIRRSA